MLSNYIYPHLTGNDKGLYATMRGGRIDPSSCLDTCWVALELYVNENSS